MCGINGFVHTTKGRAKDLTSKLDAFTDALYMNALRGTDGTGAAFVDKGTNDLTMYKRAMASSDFINTDVYSRLMAGGADYKYGIGHTRFATGVKKIQDRTAHPFLHEPIVMVHNGHITNQWEMSGKTNRFEVDSEAICWSLQQRGLDETLKMLEGAAALVWANIETGSLFLITNGERPLNIGQFDTKDGMVFGSEIMMLTTSYLRHNLKIAQWGKLKPYQLVEINPDKGILKITQLEKPTPKIYSAGTYGFISGPKGQPVQPSGTTSTPTKLNAAPLALAYPPTTERDTVLHGMGLKINDRIRATIMSFRPYKSVGKAEIRGLVIAAGCEQPYPDVVVPNVKESSIEGWNTLYIDVVGPVWNVAKQAISSTDAPTWCAVLSSKDSTFVEGEEQENENCGEAAALDAQHTLETEINKLRFWGPNGQKLTVQEFYDLAEEGCLFCAKPITPSDHYNVGWTVEKEPVCPSCAGLIKYDRDIYTKPQVALSQEQLHQRAKGGV